MRAPVVRCHHASVRTTAAVGGIAVSRSDRGAERRRLLQAVRGDVEDSESTPETEEPGAPAPDGGALAMAPPLVHCTECGRSYREPPITCDGCGATAFEERTAD